jgi:hypothetical protein
MDDNFFPNIEQEAQRAADELSEIKILIREQLGKLNQIEKRLKVIAPNIQIKNIDRTKQGIKLLFSDEHLKTKYEDLSQKYKTDTPSALAQLQSSDKVELLALAKYLGCTVSNKFAQKKLIEVIVGRLKESKLLRDSF